jgi:hypothetical protein
MTKQYYFLNTIALFIGLPAMTYLFLRDWRLALAIFLIQWANNISIRAEKKG